MTLTADAKTVFGPAAPHEKAVFHVIEWTRPVVPVVVPEVALEESSSTYRGLGEGAAKWRDLVASIWPADLVDTALCLIDRESGGNPNAKNPSSEARGLFQVMASVWAPHYGVSYDDLYDPATNTLIAFQVYLEQGFWAWSSYGGCQ